MKKYIAKRILLAIPMLFAISFIAFMLINIMPSDPAEVALRVNRRSYRIYEDGIRSK